MHVTTIKTFINGSAYGMYIYLP